MKARIGWLICAALALAAALPASVRAGDKAIEVGKEKEIRDSVGADDPKVDGMPAKVFVVKMEAGRTYRIALNKVAGDLDPFLIVLDKDGKKLAFDDDSGGMLNSLLNFAPTASGDYKVCAAALFGSGGFSLKISAGEAAKLKRLKIGGDVTRVTDALAKDALRKTVEVEFEAGKTYQIDMTSKDLDSFLILEDSTGKQLEVNDDFGGTLDSRIVFRAPAAGVYRIVATSFGMGGTGNYVLEIRENK